VVNPGWGDSVQANKAGLLEVADVFVINKADRPGVEDTRRDLQLMLDLSALSDWRPPIVKTVGTDGTGVAELWDAVLQHRAYAEASGVLERRREQRTRGELREIVAARLEVRARELCTGTTYDELEQAVLDRALDPWAAADRLLEGVGG
jgi:LAO/AO transport system kinase